MKVAILGYDTEGKVSYEYFAAQEHELTVCDQNPNTEIPEGADYVLGPDYLDNLDRFDVLVRTAGMPTERILEKNPGVEPKITTHINEFFKSSPTKNIIGITGTKGKGTTSTLLTKMLEAAGKKVFLGGNIGLPPMTFMQELDEDSWVVLELSSYQLSDLRYSPPLAVCLMVVPEHLNWHGDMDHYIAAKSNLFARQTEEDTAIYFAMNDESKKIASSGKAELLPYFAKPGAFVDEGAVRIGGLEICKTSELKLLGEHNWQNVCAALTVFWQVCQDKDAARQVVTTFTGLPHRLEFVREVNEVSYYNDSFASTPDAAIAALNTLDQPKVILVGGFDRGLKLDHLAVSISEHFGNIRRVLLVGQSGPRLASELDKIGFDNYEIQTSQDIEVIVNNASSIALSGDVVILSPGFASFDMFKNFEDRGIKYKAAVENL